MKRRRPSDMEMQILGLLWENGPMTARQVLEAMPDGKKRAYTSVLSVLQVMEKKALLTHTDRGNAHVYSPAVGKSEIMRPFMRRLVDNLFGGQPYAMMQALLSETAPNPEELRRIRQVLDALEAAPKSPGERSL